MTEIKKTDAEWRQKLSPEAYHVTREHGTERAFTSPLNDEKREGMFMCIGCGNAVFPSDTKFDSGTGWPSFTQPVEPGRVVNKVDNALGATRTEVRSKAGDAHLGHVFDDGPDPTGLRFCMNSVSLLFEKRVGR